MKRVVLLFALAGCRFGFDERARNDDSDAFVDTQDTGEAAHCTATKIAGYDIGATGMTDIAATKLPDGYAVGTTTADSILYGVHLDPQLVPNAATAMQTTPASGFLGHYSNGSLYFDGTNLVGGLTVNDGTCFLKLYQSDMMNFVSYVQRTGAIGEPSVARVSGGKAVSTWYHDNVIQYVELLADGSADATDRIFSTGGPNVTSVSAADGPAAVIAWGDGSENCGVGGLDNAFGVSLGTLALGCRKPFLHGNGSDVVAVYESTSNGNISAISLDVMANGNVTGSGARTIGTGLDPRVFAINGQRWAAWRDSSRLHMSPISTATDVLIANAPSGPPDAYEPAGPYLFAVWGSELWAITCP